jgi:hypothetical protein
VSLAMQEGILPERTSVSPEVSFRILFLSSSKFSSLIKGPVPLISVS